MHEFNDLNFEVSPLEIAPTPIQKAAPKFIKLMKKLGVPCCIAGGSLRDLVAEFDTYKDIDIFFFNEGDQEKAFERLTRNKYKHLAQQKPNADTVFFDDLRIDLVKTLHGPDPRYVINSFDFICCCAALTTDGFYTHAEFERDAYARVLRLWNPHSRVSQDRADDFIDRGWRISEEEMKKLIKIVKKLPKPKEPKRPKGLYGAWSGGY